MSAGGLNIGLWQALGESTVLPLVMTIVAYTLALALYERSARNPLINPVALSVILVIAGMQGLGMTYKHYFEGAKIIHFLLGTATVSLAIPIYECLHLLKGRLRLILMAILAGGTVSVVSAVMVSTWLQIDPEITASLYAKSVTAPIAMGIAERLHASPSLTAVSTILTGILGAVFAKYVLNLVQVKAWWMRGIAIGVASHGIGVARAFSVNQEAGTFATIAMGLHGILCALLLPLLMQL